MKKVLAVLCLFSLGLSSSATQLFPYQIESVQQIQGTVKSRGCNDFITMPSNNDFDFGNSLFTPRAAMGAIAAAAIMAVDPYIIPIDGINYVMVKDKKTNDWNEKDLLGIDDPKDNMFLSLRGLESDNDYSKITGKELKKAGIRLAKLNSDGILLVKERNQDYPLSKIKYIDMLNIKQTANSKQTGIFGHFNVYLNTKDASKKMVVGYVTFDTHSKLKIMFEQ